MANYPGPFQVKLPEIYQIEASSACELNCVMCPRKYYHREDKTSLFDDKFIDTMIKRGDLDGSYFIEFQMSGEPLIHPRIYYMINDIRNEGIITGLSTHGERFPMHFDVCENLYYITISVDSITRRREIRKGSEHKDEKEYLENLLMIAAFFSRRRILVDFQFIEIKGWQKEKEILEKFLEENVSAYNKQFVNIRTVPDCCITHRDGIRLKPDEDKGICLNPWLSVSIQSNGNVVPCCFAWGDDIIYGNIYEKSLYEIWNGEEVKKMRKNHSLGYAYLPDLCMKCYMRSPTLLHWEIYLNSVVSANRRHIKFNFLKSTIKGGQ